MRSLTLTGHRRARPGQDAAPAARRRHGPVARAGVAVPLVAAALLTVQALTSAPGPTAARPAAELLVALASLACGLLVGHLFGIPRTLRRARRGTQLEQMSDWLTKILVGVALVESARLYDLLARLTTAMQPAFGGGTPGRVLAGATLAFFTAWGFVAGYLLTRAHLPAPPRAGARPDGVHALDLHRRRPQDTSGDRPRDHEPRDGRRDRRQGGQHDGQHDDRQDGRQDEQQRHDLDALRLAHRQLIEGGVDADSLAAALRQASPLVLEQVLTLARLQRRASWDWAARFRTDARSASTMVTHHGRTIPVLKAATTVAPDDARAFGDLGYALKDRPTPDLPGADAALTRAIELAERQGSGTGWFRLNRALARIRRVPQGHIHDAAQAREIDLDIALAERSGPTLRELVGQDPDVAAWRGRRKGPSRPTDGISA